MSDQTTTRAYSVRSFCRAYGIGRTRAYEEMKSGRLKIKKLGKRTLILAEDAELWARALATPASSS